MLDVLPLAHDCKQLSLAACGSELQWPDRFKVVDNVSRRDDVSPLTQSHLHALETFSSVACLTQSPRRLLGYMRL